ncbi:MAG: prepilin-type N-terminal cleavage/methylation domain-containing protein [Romboutsia sp.]|nr:prepilin-type N-terminal cleavage/methylation domain-containing protein [Romboutsia sp.]
MITKNQGFTLIELLVTIAIVSIISAMSVSLYSEYRARAYVAMSDVMSRDFLTATQGWLVDWDGTNQGHVWWNRKADGSETQSGGGSSFKEFVPYDFANFDEPMVFFVGVNTLKLIGQDNNPLSGESWSNAGHCKSTNTNQFVYVVRNIVASTVQNYTTMANKSLNRCPGY